MPLSRDKINRITEVAKHILLSRTESFPANGEDIRNAPFHEAFLSAFQDQLAPYEISIPQLVALSSWLHGLSTSLGSGFENLASILNGGYKRKFTKEFTLNITEIQAQRIGEIIANLKRNGEPNLANENASLFAPEALNHEGRVKAIGFTADTYVETPELIEAIELKSVRPNSGEVRGEKQKILNAKAALKLNNPNHEIRFYIGFPFDPTAEGPTLFNKSRFFQYLIEFEKFFDPEEVLLGPELWNHLSGQQNTMDEILEIIRETVAVYLAETDIDL